MTTEDCERLTVDEVRAEVARLNAMAVRAHAYRDDVLWMVIYSAAESIADGLEMHCEDLNDEL